jgi:gamma-glutamylcyclotransferase (GGCT)/AIG2-like uncharacterized protein YtfP
MPDLDRRLFVYGTLLSGEPDNARLDGAEPLGPCRTEPAFHLVDLGAYAALEPGGSTSIQGELYRVDLRTILAIDVFREVPVLFKRVRIRLADGSEAEAYGMASDQLRGRRRLSHGDWRKRFTGHVRPLDGPFSRWARNRSF